MKILKGTILLNGRFFNFRIIIHAPPETIDNIGSFLQRKLQQKGWMPNVS